MSEFRELDQVGYVGPRRKVSNFSRAGEMTFINTGDVGTIIMAHTPSVFDVEFSNFDGTTLLWTVLEAAELEMVKANATH
jgi:Domain of unknown function (DUF4926)